MTAVELPVPRPGRDACIAWVADHLAGLHSGGSASERFAGGQRAADRALSEFAVDEYARRRNQVHPPSSRGASALSPYIRHGMLPLRRVWDHVADGPSRDVAKFRDELLWQEFARHWYARLGSATSTGVRREPVVTGEGTWDRSMACLDLTVGELERDGWLVNQTRMWLASEWTVRNGGRWQDGEDAMFRELLDGSRAANRLGWQWTTGAGSSKHYGFSRWQVERRAPGLCGTCVHQHSCPIGEWPPDPEFVTAARGRVDARSSSPDLSGPVDVVRLDDGSIDTVWLTAESLGSGDPALSAHRDAAVVFVFEPALLRRLQLASKRLVFLVETLAEIAAERELSVWLSRPVDVLGERRVAVTHAPVPGFARHAVAIRPVVTHPWPWLLRPGSGSVASFSAWSRSVGRVRRTDDA